MSILAPKVSVLMSVYNGSRYIQESVESILNQTLTDFEFIIVDDGSTDNTWEILTKYADRDQRIKLFKNQENIGLTKSLNKGLKLAQGEYLARQDVDDISLSDRLKIQTDFLDLHLEVGVLGSDAELINDQGKSLGYLLVPIEHENTIEHASLQAYLLINNCLLHSSLMARRKLVQNIGGYDEELRYAQDYRLWWQLGQLSHLASLSDILILVRRSGKNISTKNRLEQLLCAFKISLNALEESLEGQSLDKEAYQRFWWAYLQLLDKKAYQRFWLAYHDRYAQLTAQDIRRLQPLWDLLANHPGEARVWGTPFQNLALHFLRHRQTLTGLHLLWISARQLKMPIQWSKTIRALVKPYVPKLGQQLCKVWKTENNKVDLHST